MKKIILFVIVAFAMIFPAKTNAQIKRSGWSYGPVIQTDNFIYSSVVGDFFLKSIPPMIAGIESVMEEDMTKVNNVSKFYEANAWWIPEFRYRANVVQNMEFANGKAMVYPRKFGFSHMDWSMRNYAIGYHVGFLPRLFPLGFDFEVDYSQDGYQLLMEGWKDRMDITKRMLNVTTLLKIRFLRYDNKNVNPVIEIGTSYNYAFHYHDDFINDKNAVNNGFTGVIGVGYTNTSSHFSFSLRYEHAFYNFYNKKYLFEGMPIFEGSKSTFGRLSWTFCMGF